MDKIAYSRHGGEKKKEEEKREGRDLNNEGMREEINGALKSGCSQNRGGISGRLRVDGKAGRKGGLWRGDSAAVQRGKGGEEGQGPGAKILKRDCGGSAVGEFLSQKIAEFLGN